MYESYFGFAEKPFSLTPDPKYLYRSESHANAFELLQYALERREGFVVITGDIGTGKTTLCRALLEQTDTRTFTALLLNPFLSEEDLLLCMLRDFGVLSRGFQPWHRTPSRHELIAVLHQFLRSVDALGARAVVIMDEAQNLPLAVLEQIRILSNLETSTHKLLQVVLIGQRNLATLLRSPELRQLDQRIAIRYELQPLADVEEVAAYITHRLTMADGARPVMFTRQALSLVHRYSRGIPRVVNLICDRALLAAYAETAEAVTGALVTAAADDLQFTPPRRERLTWLARIQQAFGRQPAPASAAW